jgi:hypothetical protein
MNLKNMLNTMLVATIMTACSSTVIPIRTQQDANYSSLTQNFNEANLWGKWLTNMPRETTSSITLNKDYSLTTNTNRVGTYTIKKDSIIMYYPDATARGRLLEQTDARLYILWGGADAVKYYRQE